MKFKYTLSKLLGALASRLSEHLVDLWLTLAGHQGLPFVVYLFSLVSLPRSQLTINTAIVYMHRFYMLNSFTKFHRNVSTHYLVLWRDETQPLCFNSEF